METRKLGLFVYGTLRRGCDNEWARQLRSSSEYICAGRLHGSLYRIAQYPGLVEDSLESWVTGEIWMPRTVQLLDRLDEYEGTEYARVARNIDTPNGPIEAWVYLYRASIDGKSRITSGDWCSP